MSGPLEEFKHYDGPERQVRGPFAELIPALDDLFVPYKQILEHDKVFKQTMEVTPAATFEHYVSNAGVDNRTVVVGSARFFRPAAAHKAKKHVYCSLTHDTADKSTILRLQIDRELGIAEDLDNPGENFADATLLTQAITATQSTLKSELRAHADERRHKRMVCAGLLSALAIAGAVAGGVYELIHIEHEKELRAAAKIKAFDRSGYSIPGPSFRLANTPLVHINDRRFESIPEYQDGNPLVHPLRFSLDEKSCKQFGIKVLAGEKVHLGVRDTDPFANESFLAGVDNHDTLYVCSPADFKSDSNSNKSIELAVQVIKP